MPEESIFSNKEIAFLQELNREDVEYIIVGLSAAALQGAPVVTQDVDLWFRDLADQGIQNALQRVEGTYIPPIGSNPPMFVGDAVKLFDIVLHMHGLDGFDKEKQNTIKVQIGRLKVRVLILERIICSKEATGREKDKLALPVLRDALTVIRATEERENHGKRG